MDINVYIPALVLVLSDLVTRFGDYILPDVHQIYNDFFYRFPPLQASGYNNNNNNNNTDIYTQRKLETR